MDAAAVGKEQFGMVGGEVVTEFVGDGEVNKSRIVEARGIDNPVFTGIAHQTPGWAVQGLTLNLNITPLCDYSGIDWQRGDTNLFDNLLRRGR